MFDNIYEGKKVLVTGNTGFKGSWLSAWLKRLGAEVIGVSNKVPTTPSHFETLKLDHHTKTAFIDIRNFSEYEAFINDEKPVIIFHLAAEAIVRTCYDAPRLGFETNFMGTVNTLEILRKTNFVKSAVFITSDKCYENVEWIYGYRENDQLGGKDPHSASKACAELALSSYQRSYFSHRNDIHIASARAGNVIGGGDWGKDRIVPDCMKSWEKNETVEIRSPNATRPWQLVLEPLSGYLHLGSQLYLGQKRQWRIF